MPEQAPRLGNLHALALRLERAVDALRLRRKRRAGYAQPIAVQPHRGYGSIHRVHLHARVVEHRSLRAPTPHDRPWVNLVRSVKTLETDEVPRARVRVRFAGRERELVADDEGFLVTTFDATGPGTPGHAFAPGRPEVVYELLEPHGKGQQVTRFQGEVFIPSPAARWVIVSDVDDTVMHTQATSLVRMAVNTLFTNAYGRVAFPGVGAFYRALGAGPEGRDGRNPVFYLTSSPWGVYDLIATFCDVNGLPPGPLIMRDLGLSRDHWFKSSHAAHKLRHVRELLALYPDQRFILIGDTGQHDAEIYLQACREAPGRVLAVYLRDVSRAAQRDSAVAAIAEEIRGLGVACVAAEDTVAHAEHAASQGWITEADLSAVRGGTRKDKREGAG